jgi:hypothetical protein
MDFREDRRIIFWLTELVVSFSLRILMYHIVSNNIELDFEYTIEAAIRNAKNHIPKYKNVEIKDGDRVVWTGQKEKATA